MLSFVHIFLSLSSFLSFTNNIWAQIILTTKSHYWYKVLSFAKKKESKVNILTVITHYQVLLKLENLIHIFYINSMQVIPYKEERYKIDLESWWDLELFWTICVYIYIYIYVCVCVCVCERERERERESSYFLFKYKKMNNMQEHEEGSIMKASTDLQTKIDWSWFDMRISSLHGTSIGDRYMGQHR